MRSLDRRLEERRRFAGLSDWLAFLALSTKVPGMGLAAVKVRLRGRDRPFLLRPGTTDYAVFKDIFLWDEYEPVRALVPREAGLVVDLGSNVGLSIRYWQECFPSARIVGVEPDSKNLGACRANLGVGAGRVDGATLVRACVAGSAGEVHLDCSRGSWGIRIATQGRETAQRVRAMTMPELLSEVDAQGPIDLLKCDIEGAESGVFAECREWIRRVRVLLVETHPPYSNAALRADVERNAPGLFEDAGCAKEGIQGVVYMRRRGS